MPTTTSSQSTEFSGVRPYLPRASDIQLPSDVQDELFAVARRRKLPRGSFLFEKGSMPDAFFGVISGSLRASASAEGGREVVVSTFEPGHWFGEVALFVGLERVYDIRAVEATEIAVVAARDFHQLVERKPTVHLALTHLVCMRLRLALAWIDDAILHPLPVRLANRLLAVDQRMRDSATSGVLLNISQQDLALLVGVSRQSVNRQLKLWELEGTVRIRYRSIELLNAEKLRQHANATD